MPTQQGKETLDGTANSHQRAQPRSAAIGRNVIARLTAITLQHPFISFAAFMLGAIAVITISLARVGPSARMPQPEGQSAAFGDEENAELASVSTRRALPGQVLTEQSSSPSDAITAAVTSLPTPSDLQSGTATFPTSPTPQATAAPAASTGVPSTDANSSASADDVKAAPSPIIENTDIEGSESGVGSEAAAAITSGNDATTLPGEQFPQTRSRLLSASDVQQWPPENLQYAINEMYARRGVDFGNPRITNWFRQFSWYQPQPGRDPDTVEAAMPQLESENLRLLGAVRDSQGTGSTATNLLKQPQMQHRSANQNFPPDPVGQMIGRFFQSIKPRNSSSHPVARKKQQQ
jgi:hypothetical protein